MTESQRIGHRALADFPVAVVAWTRDKLDASICLPEAGAVCGEMAIRLTPPRSLEFLFALAIPAP